MAATVLGAKAWLGDWAALGSWPARVGWLLAVVGAGGLAYGLGLLLGGLRPRHLREA